MKKLQADLESIRLTDKGAVIGCREKGVIHCWRGIPYAQPPVGDLRWRAPRPARAWEGTLEALAYKDFAPQYAGLLTPVPKARHGTIVGSENCLYLNVFAPVLAPSDVPQGKDLRPVMVWIHGGGNAVGTSNTYDVLRNYAEQDDVIVVSINYRLGILGWFCHPRLLEADDVTPEDASGNFGTLDLIAALRWVRDNIQAFGGCPSNVTIFGESAGGQNVLTLLASPLAKGLFHRAIAQSPVANTVSRQEAILCNGLPLQAQHMSSEEVSQRLVRKFPADSQDLARYLRSLSAEQLLSVFTPGTAGIYLSPRPIRDGVVLPSRPLNEVFASDTWNRVPVIIGSNRDEYRTFMADKPEHTRMYFGRLPILRNRESYLRESSFHSRTWRAANVNAIADAMVAGGHKDVWTYRFDWDEAPAVPLVRPDLLLGAAHAMEMAFAFRDTRGELDLFGINTRFNRSGRESLCKAMGNAWTSFAHSGAPNPGPGIDWEKHDPVPDRSRTLVFDSPQDSGIRMASCHENIDDIKQELLSDEEISYEDRYAIYSRVFIWSPLFHHLATQDDLEQLKTTIDSECRPDKSRPSMEI